MKADHHGGMRVLRIVYRDLEIVMSFGRSIDQPGTWWNLLLEGQAVPRRWLMTRREVGIPDPTFPG